MKKPDRKKSFSQSIATVAFDAVSRKGYVSATDLMSGLNWLTQKQLNDWRQGKVLISSAL